MSGTGESVGDAHSGGDKFVHIPVQAWNCLFAVDMVRAQVNDRLSEHYKSQEKEI